MARATSVGVVTFSQVAHSSLQFHPFFFPDRWETLTVAFVLSWSRHIECEQEKESHNGTGGLFHTEEEPFLRDS